MILYSRWNCVHKAMEISAGFTKETWDRADWRGRSYERKMARYRFWDKWLENRLTLFEHFTYPSVLSQTNQDFRWIGIVHKDSPKWFIEYLEKFDRMEIALVEEDIEAGVKGDSVSINLDTDDSIARNFMEEASKVNFEGETIFEHGLKYRVYTNFWLDNYYALAHFNIINHPEYTVFNFLHGRSPLPKNIIRTKNPMWLEVIHEKNIGNKLRATNSRRSNLPVNMGLEYAIKYFEFNTNNLTIEHLIADFLGR